MNAARVVYTPWVRTTRWIYRHHHVVEEAHALQHVQHVVERVACVGVGRVRDKGLCGVGCVACVACVVASVVASVVTNVVTNVINHASNASTTAPLRLSLQNGAHAVTHDVHQDGHHGSEQRLVLLRHAAGGEVAQDGDEQEKVLPRQLQHAGDQLRHDRLLKDGLRVTRRW